MFKHEPQTMRRGWKKACIIIYKPRNIDIPKDEYLVNSGTRNPDGVGIALLKDSATSVLIKKDFKDTQAMISWTKENVKKEDDLVVHFRIATHGLKDEGNRHPFPMVGIEYKELLRETNLSVEIAVAHNGVLSQYNKQDDKVHSDTQLFIMDILSKEIIKNNIENDTILKLIQEYIGSDKLFILKANGQHIMIGNFSEHEGCYYSNKSYEPIKEIKRTEYIGYNSSWDRKSVWNTLKCTKCGTFKQTTHEDYKTYVCSDCYYAEKNKNNKANYKNKESVCEHCKELKVVKECKVGTNAYLMCKKCRRDVAKGKITESMMLEKLYGKFNKKLDEEVKQDEVVCDNCDKVLLKKDTILIYGQFLVCKECAKKMDDNEEEEYIECDFCGEPMELKDAKTTPISNKLVCNHCAEMLANAGSRFPARCDC